MTYVLILLYFLRVNDTALFGKSSSLSDPETPTSPLLVSGYSVATKKCT